MREVGGSPATVRKVLDGLAAAGTVTDPIDDPKHSGQGSGAEGLGTELTRTAEAARQASAPAMTSPTASCSVRNPSCPAIELITSTPLLRGIRSASSCCSRSG